MTEAAISYAYHVGKISVRSQGSNNAVCGGIAGTASTVSSVYHEGGLYCFTTRSSPDINGCVGDADTATRTKMYSRGQTYKNNSPFSLPTSGSDQNTRITLEDDMVEEFFKDTLGFITQYWNFDGISATQVKYPTLIKDAPQEF